MHGSWQQPPSVPRCMGPSIGHLEWCDDMTAASRERGLEAAVPLKTWPRKSHLPPACAACQERGASEHTGEEREESLPLPQGGASGPWGHHYDMVSRVTPGANL